MISKAAARRETALKAMAKEAKTMSFKPEVQTSEGGKFAGNALRFATKEEAEHYVLDLMMRWTMVRDTRVIEVDDPVNYRWDEAKGAVSLRDEP